MRRKLKLFVWRDVLVDNTSGIAIAMAHDEIEARKVLADSAQEQWIKDWLLREIGKPPTEVHDVPAGAFVMGGG